MQQVAKLSGSALPSRGGGREAAGWGCASTRDAKLTLALPRRPHPASRRWPPSPQGEGAPRLKFMMSSGGLTAADLFQGKDAILSGPAGGVVGMVETAKLAGFDKVIGFDMGGTSTDVAHYDGEYERAFDTEVAGVRIRAPMMRIHTVAAGGGRSCTMKPDVSRGPDSAAPIRVRPATGAAGRLPSPTRTSCSANSSRTFSRRSSGRTRTSRSTRKSYAQNSGHLALRSATAARRSHRRRFCHHRRREHGQRHQEDFRPARLRCD